MNQRKSPCEISNHQSDSSPLLRRQLLQVGLSAAVGTAFAGSTINESLGQGFGQGFGQGNRQAPAAEGFPCPVDPSNPAIVWRRGRCELCDHCEKSCGKTQSVMGYFDLAKTGRPICIHCGQCTNLCKSSAMTERYDYPIAKRMIQDKSRTTVISVAPSVRVSLGEWFGMEQGANVEGQTVAALRKLGFDKVFDATFGADLTIIEEATELVERIKSGQTADKTDRLPMFTSCCPGWVKFAEYWYPDFLPNLSSVRSPLLMQGALVKTYFAETEGIAAENIDSVIVAPCTAKKFERTRPEMNKAGLYAKQPGIRDVDVAITVRELGRWIEESGINFKALEPEPFDSLMGRGSDAGLIFGNTGGVMEAALRTAYFLVNGKNPTGSLLNFTPIRGLDAVKESVVDLGEVQIKVAAVHGGANTRALMDKLRSGEAKYDFVEVMICPGGCIGGGGQPKVQGRVAFQESRQNRNAGLYSMTEHAQGQPALRFSHENPQVQKLYADFLLKDNSNDRRAQLLHTYYQSRAEELG